MKNLQKEIIKGLKQLGLSQQYSVLEFLKAQNNHTMRLTNRFFGVPENRTLAMEEIRRAITAGPEMTDF